MHIWFKASVAIAGLVMWAGQAQANTILNFENGEFPGLVAMGNAPGAAVPASAQLSNQFLASDGVAFNSGAGYIAVVNHDAVFTPSPPNVIGGTTSGGALNYDSPIFATFFMPSNTSTLAMTDFVQVLGDLIPLNIGSATLTAFDALGNVVGSVTEPDTGAAGTGLTLTLHVAGIHSVSFAGNNGTIAFDNFEFGDLVAVPAVTAVPEPVTLSLFGAGLAGAIGLRRRRKAARQV